MEKLAIDAESTDQVSTIQWQLIPYQNLVSLPSLDRPFSIGLNSEEILILGGANYEEHKVHLYDTRTDSCSSVAIKEGAFKFWN